MKCFGCTKDATGVMWSKYHEKYADGTIAICMAEQSCEECAIEWEQMWCGKAREFGFIPGLITSDIEIVEDFFNKGEIL